VSVDGGEMVKSGAVKKRGTGFKAWQHLGANARRTSFEVTLGIPPFPKGRRQRLSLPVEPEV